MEPTNDFWSGVGQGVARADGWMVVVALTLVVLVIGVLIVYAKYINPSRERLRERELDIRQREAENDSERIKANAALAENMRGLRESNDQLAQQSAALFAGIEESKVRSRGMGEDMSHVRETSEHIRGTTDETNSLVKDIRRHLVGGEGTD